MKILKCKNCSIIRSSGIPLIYNFTAHGLSYHSDEFPPTIRVSQVTNPLNVQETFIIAVIS